MGKGCEAKAEEEADGQADTMCGREGGWQRGNVKEEEGVKKGVCARGKEYKSTYTAARGRQARACTSAGDGLGFRDKSWGIASITVRFTV